MCTYSFYAFAVYLYSVCIRSICLFTYVAGSILDGSTEFTFENIHQIRQSEQTVHAYVPDVQCLCEVTTIFTYIKLLIMSSTCCYLFHLFNVVCFSIMFLFTYVHCLSPAPRGRITCLLFTMRTSERPGSPPSRSCSQKVLCTYLN